MARQLDKFPAGGGKWKQFLDGNVWELKRGQDFGSDVAPLVARNRMNAAAQRLGLLLKTRIVDDQTLIVQAIPRSSQ